MKNKEELWDFAKFFVVSALVVITIRIFVVEPYKVLGQSMVPTFTGEGNERVAIWKMGTYTHGDIVVAKPEKETPKIIKRVIGIPGDKVQVRNDKVYLNGEELVEEYVKDGVKTISEDHDMHILQENEYYLMGDNRPASYDSRQIGIVQEEDIIGRVVAQYWPYKDWRTLKQEDK